MKEVLIYREDLKTLLIKENYDWKLPKTNFDDIELIKSDIKEKVGFSVNLSEPKDGLLIARRIFGPGKESETTWVSIKNASKLLSKSQEDLTKLVQEDIDHWHKIQLQTIGEVFDLFKTNSLEIYLSGGWGVDFLAGKITRPHVDIDSLVWKKDKEKIRNLLKNAGFISIDKTRKFQCRSDEVQFDTDFVEASGKEFISSKGSDNKGIKWSKKTFSHSVRAKLGNITVKVINPKEFASFLELKLKYNRDNPESSGPLEKTEHDIKLLKEYLSH